MNPLFVYTTQKERNIRPDLFIVYTIIVYHFNVLFTYSREKLNYFEDEKWKLQ